MFPRVTHPSATPRCQGVRLACVKPAASVRSEPGSNSQVVDNSKTSNPTDHSSSPTPKGRTYSTSPKHIRSRPKRPKRDESGNVTVGKVLSPCPKARCLPKAGRKDPAVHVSLSSDEIVKQRRADIPPRRHTAQTRKPYQGRRRHTRQTLPGHDLQSELGKTSKPAGHSVSSAAVDDAGIGPRSQPRQPGFSRNRQKPRPGPESPPASRTPTGPQAKGNRGTLHPPLPHPYPHPPCRTPSPATGGEGTAGVSPPRGRSRRRPAWCGAGPRAGEAGSGAGPGPRH